MVREIRLIIVGFGTVGQALAEELERRREELKERIGGVAVVAVADSRSSTVNQDGLDLGKLIETKQRSGAVGKAGTPGALELINGEEADILVEVASAGGTDGEPGLSRISRALENGLHVVSSNKMPLAVSYERLFRKARSKGLEIRHGACVGAGIPIIEFGEALAASETVTRIDGVLNATSNYVLTNMEREGLSMEESLKRAKSAGYAEANPSLDIDGVDAACKIVILGNAVLGRRFTLRDVREMSGIRRVTEEQVERAKRRNRRIRMIATVDDAPRVGIVELPGKDPLSIEGPSHVARFRCVPSGDRFVGGEGAGGRSTSLAVLRDIIREGKSLRGAS